MPLTPTQARSGRDRLTPILALGLLSAVWPGSVPAQEAPKEKSAAVSSTRAEPVPEGLNYANGLFRDRRYELAAEEYERFLNESPKGAHADEARFGLANARLFQGQYDKARRQFEAFLEAAPQHANRLTALYRVGETSYMLGDLPVARRALESFTANAKGHRNLETAWPYLGEVCLRMQDLPRATQAYEQALQLHPKGRLADRSRFGLGRTLALQGKSAEAVKILTELAEQGGGDWTDRAWLQIGQSQVEAKQFAPAVEAFETLERVTPKSPLVGEARLGRAEALILLDRRGEGETLLSGLMADSSQNLAAQAAFALGSSQLEGGRAAEGLATFDQASEKFAKTALAPALIFRSGEAAQKLGQLDEARTRFQKAADSDPKHPWADDALIRASRLALESGDKAAAKALAGSFATKFPESPLRADAKLIEGQVAYNEGGAKQAIQILSQLLAEAKPAPETAQAALYYLGLAYRADGQKAKADEVLDSLAKTPAAPAAANAQYLVGQGHFEAKRFAEAIPALEKYLAGNSNGEVAADAMTYIVWSRLELGQVDEASKALGRLAQRFPKSETLPSTRLRLGWALLEAERPVEAAAEFATLLDSAPDDKLAPEAALGRAQALQTAKQPEDALKAFALIAEKYPKTDQAVQADLARARLLVELKQPAEGAEIFQRYLTDYPDKAAKAPKGAEPDAVLAEWGWALLDAEKTAEADRVFGRLLSEYPESVRAADARLILAQSAYDAKTYDEVVSLLTPLVAEGANTAPRLLPSALFLMGRARDKRAELDEAAKAIDRLLKEFPEDRYRREARFLRADIALKGGDAGAAALGFEALATEPPAETDPERFGVAIRRGRIQSLVALKQWDKVIEAAADFKSFGAKDPLIAEVEYDRGRALQQLSRFDEALAAYQAVIDARKGGDLAARAQLMRGESYFWQKQYKEALREYFRVATLYDAPAWQAAALLEAGKVYERLDQWAVAAETYEELRAKFPKDPTASEAKTRLEAARRHAQASSETETR
ncbi:tetratricopeptide repeat protein [Singulisphaera sp. GP187]|uniref:tetratricopeptide repeat protein n=1 Tax=Singulisphaera sp. GP187 TaxID=1882752 RepID=UPI0020B151F8|nr:tetratricopeptide repeat protein [Singulisphaera sp. GP187]